jgi:hypothetical protein
LGIIFSLITFASKIFFDFEFKLGFMKNISIAILIIFSFTILCDNIYAQNDNSIYYNKQSLLPADSNKLIFHLTNSNFLKNNEYFNEIVDGFTFIGFFIQPKLIYYPSSNTRLEGGIHLLKYSGKSGFTQVLPMFAFCYKPVKSLTFVIGSLSGTINHQLIEPISQFDRYYYDNVENGLQLLIETKYFQSDIWLNWEKFILQDEQEKEQFSFGCNANLFLTDPNSKNVIYFPLQVLLFHKGGQYKNDTVPLQTIENSATGIAFEHIVDNNFIKSIGTKNYFCTYNDLSNINQFKYVQGWGESSNIFIKSKNIYLMLGYWYGECFISPKGEPLFLSNSLKYNYYYEAYRNLFTGKFQINKNIAKGINIGLRFESYYEFAKKDFDFSYGLNLLFDREFFLWNIK